MNANELRNLMPALVYTGNPEIDAELTPIFKELEIRAKQGNTQAEVIFRVKHFPTILTYFESQGYNVAYSQEVVDKYIAEESYDNSIVTIVSWMPQA